MRYLVLRGFRHSKDLAYLPGQFLDAETIKDIDKLGKMLVHVKRGLVIDREFEHDVRVHDRGIHRRRLQCLREMKTDSSKEFLALALKSYQGKVPPKLFEYVTGIPPKKVEEVKDDPTPLVDNQELLFDETNGDDSKYETPLAETKEQEAAVDQTKVEETAVAEAELSSEPKVEEVSKDIAENAMKLKDALKPEKVQEALKSDAAKKAVKKSKAKKK
jgi:hypothetical protein